MTGEELAQKIRDCFDEESGIVLAVVFGSRAFGTETQKSDLDIGVASRDELSVEDKIRVAQTLSSKFACEVDLIDLRTAHGVLLQEILTRGTLVIHRDPVLYEMLIKRMLAEHEDDSRIASKARAERVRRWSHQTKR
ncbi:MAG: nucleotidyltransferase domain-containing protein [Proteobacteria bacterium]|nr:nucleotidyltransferase domain-containing protein [Pseudomonadota bacterium]